MDTFFETALTRNDDVGTLVQFVVTNELTGIELDFEDFGGWSVASYANYKNLYPSSEMRSIGKVRN